MQQGVLNVKVLNCLTALCASLLILGVFAAPAAAQVRPPISGGIAPAAAPPTTSQAQRPTGTSVAVIDLQEVFKQHGRFKAAMEDLKKDGEALAAYQRTEQAKLQKMLEQLKDLKPGSPEYKRKEEEMAHIDSDVRVQISLKRKDLRDREAKLHFQAYEEISAAVQEFSERNGIGLVVRFSADDIDPSNPESIMMGLSRQVVYQRNLNITEFVIQMINRHTPPANAGQAGRPTIPPR
jgi:Skp family chaperone for outer membrane proteins